jgi:2,3-bisphosphoglycerate-independent phosphoglycerate mutase
VPFVVTRDGVELAGPGILADVAPTILQLLSIPKPADMSGRSLLED